MNAIDELRCENFNATSFFQYYRSNLSSSLQKAYDLLIGGIINYDNYILIKDLTIEQLQDIYQKVMLDNPIVFFVESISYQQTLREHSYKVFPKYRFSKKEIDATLQAVRAKYEMFIKKNQNKSALFKEESVHNLLCETVVYDESFAASSFECIGPLLFGKGVCEGISKATKFLLDWLKVKSLVVHGKSLQRQGNDVLQGESHAWNIVSIEKAFYHLDVTFDITVSKFGIVRFDYFNLSDEEIQHDHITSIKSLPICACSNNYYYSHNLLMYSQDNYKRFLISQLNCGIKDVVFKIPKSKDFESAKNKILCISKACLQNILISKYQFQLVYNEYQSVFHLHIF